MSTLHVLERSRQRRVPALPSRTELERAMERTLAQLAEVDRRYDHERRVIEGALHPECWKSWSLEQLQLRHREERQPLTQLLCSLHQQIASRNIAFARVLEADACAEAPDGSTADLR